MNNPVKCFDVVSMVVEEATKQFAPLWKESEEDLKILKEYCNIIDALSEEFGGEAYKVEVDDIKMTVSVSVDCKDILINTKTNGFYALVERAISVGFSAIDSGAMTVTFVFPSVWERA